MAGLLAHRALISAWGALLVAAGVTALVGLAVLGALAPVRARQVRRRLTAGTGVAAPGVAAAVTGAVLLVGIAAAVAILMRR